MTQNESLKRQLQSLKRDLKGWEAMFERKHGHKPTKADIEESPGEIRETYREYKLRVKSRLSGEGTEEKKVKRVHFEDNIECQRSPPPPIQSTKEDGIFGISLNKKPKKKTNGDFYVGGRREGEGEIKNVWKLRRWSKSRGHHTVVVKKEGKGEREEEERREDEQRREEHDKDMAGSGPNSDKMSSESLALVECDLTAELEQLSHGVHFKDLATSSSQQREQHTSLLNSLTQEQEEGSEPASFVPVAGQCSNRLHFNMASRSPTKSTRAPTRSTRLKHCRNVSEKWLERCKPDLLEFDSEPPADSVRLSDSGEMERSSGEESEGEIEEDSNLEDSDGLCEEDLWEEEEEQEVEPVAFEECIHDNQGEGASFASAEQ